jgi:glycosyltransferase involved in cell wall biosynthesis
MKKIALLPFKNEEHILPLYLKNVLPIVDEVIAIDDNSTDNSVQVLESSSNKVKIYSNEEKIKSGWAEFNIRQRLLELGRQAGGTHFICLDADETFTTNFLSVADKVINKLQPGQKLALQWIALWKCTDHYKNDNTVWSNNYKDFIIFDNPSLKHDYAFLGVGRTPGINNDDTWIKLNPKYGAVLHYQFSHWKNFQLKQAWYRMSELIKMGPGNEGSINQKYSITLDNQTSHVSKCPDEWLKDIPKYDIDHIPASWHLEKIKGWFKEYGKDYFKNLDIWHINEISSL